MVRTILARKKSTILKKNKVFQKFCVGCGGLYTSPSTDEISQKVCPSQKIKTFSKILCRLWNFTCQIRKVSFRNEISFSKKFKNYFPIFYNYSTKYT